MRHDGDSRGEHRTGHNGSRRPEEILAEIEQTRQEMDSTLTAIEQRLTPGQLVDQGLDYLRSSGANEFVQNLGIQAKNNPLPLSLVGIGLAWLMASSKNPPARTATESYGSSMSDRAGEIRDKASGMAGAARSKLSDGTQAVGDRVRQARDSLTSAGQSARHQMERARGGMEYLMREQPVALGAVGLAIGALLAAIAPRTRQEDELMGETRDRLMDKAKESGQDALQKAGGAAKKGIEQVKESAKPESTKPDPAKPAMAPPLGADLTPRRPGGPGNKP